MSLLKRFSITRAPRAVIIIRAMVGAIFLSEGLQKFLFPEADGVGRFIRIGIPWPEIMAPFVGGVETTCGLLILFGLLTRLAAVPLLITMSVAILSTKITVLLKHGFWGFSLPKLDQYGFWSMAHEGRADFSMLMGLLFLLVVGGGAGSMDARLARSATDPKIPRTP
jgi:putative oxidoreductase